MSKLTETEYNEVIDLINGYTIDIAFDILYNKYQGLVYTVLSKYIRDEETRQDLKQEVFLRIWLYLKNNITFPKTSKKFSAFIYSMAKFTAWEYQIKQWRDAAARAMPLENHEDLDLRGEGDLATPEQHAIVSQIIAVDDAVNKGDMEAFRLVEVEGMSVADVAKELGVSTNAVYQRLHRVKNWIRKGIYREV